MKKILIIIIAILLFIIFSFETHAITNPLAVPNNIYGMGVVNLSDFKDVSDIVNNNGSWGYIKIVLTENDRDKEVLQNFFDNLRRNKLIPILRIATKYNQDKNYWEKPKYEEMDNWISFLNSLNWVTLNRYIIIANEPNHSKEWGGEINPQEYATFLKEFSLKLKNSNSDYFVLNAGFDQSAPNSSKTMDEALFLKRMLKKEPDLFNYIDGWNSHSYPNPNFSGKPTDTGRKSIKGYKWELDYLSALGVKKELPVFITETGWIYKQNSEDTISQNFKYSFENVWANDNKIVAVTPFILNYLTEPFYHFSWKKDENTYYKVYQEIKDLKKVEGKPTQRINGKIIFSFLNPFTIKNRSQKGYVLVKNTGQAIWYENDLRIKGPNKNIQIQNISLNSLEPFRTGLVVYTLKHPDQESLEDINLGLFVADEKIGDVFSGSIVSF